jgi:DNA-binding MarR family transcriptional regulator
MAASAANAGQSLRPSAIDTVPKYHGSVVVGTSEDAGRTVGMVSPMTPTRPTRGRARRTLSSQDFAGPERRISLLFDVFVLNQHLRSLLAAALDGTGMSADQYAVYSLLFETGPLAPTDMATRMGMPLTTVLDYVRPMLKRRHASRSRHPSDGRSYLVTLTVQGLAAFYRTNAAWNKAIERLEPAINLPVADVRRALHALDDAAVATLESLGPEPPIVPAPTVTSSPRPAGARKG